MSPEERAELLTGILTELGIDIVTTEQWDAIKERIATALREAADAEREACAQTIERLNIPLWDRERAIAAIRARQ